MARMKLKRISKKHKYKFLFLILITYLFFTYTIYYSFKNISYESNEAFITYLLENGNPTLKKEKQFPKIISSTISYLLKIDFAKPVSLFNENILGYNNEENIDDDELAKLKQVSFYMSDPSKNETKEPIIYLYNSHQLENYNNKNLEIYGITPNVLMASYLLKEKLNNVGLPTIVEETNMAEFLSINNWNYAASYKASRMFLLDKKNTYPSLKYFIDIHRDSVGKDLTTIKIGNKTYAKILFVIGLEHKNYEANLSFVTKLNTLFEKNYPGLSRGIYKKEGPNVNGIYNQDIDPSVILIEVGGVDNNIEEVMNTLSAICDILKKYIG